MSGAALVSLSPGCRKLIALMQETNFGEIRDLWVKDGQPVFQPAPTIIRHVKLGADNGPRPERAAADFRIRREVQELLGELGRIGTGRILRIAIKHGIPTDLLMEREVRE